jgi:hypothetical protein
MDNGMGWAQSTVFFSAMDKNAGIDGMSVSIFANNSKITNTATSLTHVAHSTMYLFLNYCEKIVNKIHGCTGHLSLFTGDIYPSTFTKK